MKPKPPLYHEMIAEGVPEDKAIEWHNAISTLKSHADNLSRSIRFEGTEWTPEEAAGFYEDWKAIE